MKILLIVWHEFQHHSFVCSLQPGCFALHPLTATCHLTLRQRVGGSVRFACKNSDADQETEQATTIFQPFKILKDPSNIVEMEY